MKKLILIGLLGVMITSCQKEYVCECTVYWGDGSISGIYQSTVKGTPNKALEKCESKGNLPNGGGYTTCNLK